MASLPTVGGSDGTWGAELNAYLGVEHNTDGTHKATEVTAVVTGEGIFGTRTRNDTSAAAIAIDVNYQAASDGILNVWVSSGGNSDDTLAIYSDATDANVTGEGAAYLVAYSKNGNSTGTGGSMFVSAPIKKSDYVRIVTGNNEPVIGVWVPIGSGGLAQV